MPQILLLTGFSYLMFILYLLLKTATYHRNHRNKSNPSPPSVSIVIPCRDEAHHIPQLLASLAKQQHNGAFEVLVVNDRSIDGTAELTRKLAATSSIPIRCIDSEYDETCVLTGKQQAIDFGMQSARYDWVLLTDADMEFTPDWIGSYASSCVSNPDLIFGHTSVISDKKNLFTLLQSYFLEFLFAVAAAFHYARIAGSCMGNNIMIKKETYRKTGGFQSIGYSITEDRALLYYLMKHQYKIDIVTPFTPSAFTHPVQTIGAYVEQLLRWARGGISYGGNLLFITIIFLLQNFSFVYIFFGKAGLLLTILTLCNFICTWIMVTGLFRRQNAPVSALLFPLFYLCILVGTILLPLYGLTRRKIVWKGSRL